MSRSGVNKQGGKHRRSRHAQKVCSYCNLSLPLKAFHRRASSPDGFSSRCKRCTKALKQKRRFENTVRTLRRAAEKYEEWRTKKKARRIANDRFAPWGPCAVLGCGKPGRKHHIDYRDPTAVIYLCHDHHCGLHEMIEFLHHLGLTGFTPAAAGLQNGDRVREFGCLPRLRVRCTERSGSIPPRSGGDDRAGERGMECRVANRRPQQVRAAVEQEARLAGWMTEDAKGTDARATRRAGMRKP